MQSFIKFAFVWLYDLKIFKGKKSNFAFEIFEFHWTYLPVPRWLFNLDMPALLMVSQSAVQPLSIFLVSLTRDFTSWLIACFPGFERRFEDSAEWQFLYDELNHLQLLKSAAFTSGSPETKLTKSQI